MRKHTKKHIRRYTVYLLPKSTGSISHIIEILTESYSQEKLPVTKKSPM